MNLKYVPPGSLETPHYKLDGMNSELVTLSEWPNTTKWEFTISEYKGVTFDIEIPEGYEFTKVVDAADYLNPELCKWIEAWCWFPFEKKYCAVIVNDGIDPEKYYGKYCQKRFKITDWSTGTRIGTTVGLTFRRTTANDKIEDTPLVANVP